MEEEEAFVLHLNSIHDDEPLLEKTSFVSLSSWIKNEQEQ